MERVLCPFVFFHNSEWLGFYLCYSVNVSDCERLYKLEDYKVKRLRILFFVGSKQNAPDNPACY